MVLDLHKYFLFHSKTGDSLIFVQFARYLAQEMHSREQFNSSADASDEDEDEDGGWLAQSSFDLGRPPLRRNTGNRQEISSSGFDVGTSPLHHCPKVIRLPRMHSILAPVAL
jgi:hypothetical protein